MRKPVSVLLQLLLGGVLSVSHALAQVADSPAPGDPSPASTNQRAANQPASLKSLFGKPERISGKISMVVPDQRLIVLTVPANEVPKFLMVLEDSTTVTPHSESVVKHHKKVVLTQSTAASFNFKVTSATAIKVGGRPMAGSLTALNDKQATVRFVPLRSGNIAQTIDADR
jgi:hypothetical protein